MSLHTPFQSAAPAGFLRSGSGGAQSLGKNAKVVDEALRQERRKDRFSLKMRAAKLLRPVSESGSRRLAGCCYSTWGAPVSLLVKEGRARFHGLQTCSNVWNCAICADRINRTRKEELDHLLKWARIEGFTPVMLTLTAAHRRSDALKGLLKGMKLAKRRFRQLAKWRKLPFVGSVTATEVTHGGNGWHVHFHEILLLQCGPDDALKMCRDLLPEWQGSLASQGMTGNEHALDAQDASFAGAYVAKFGPAGEIALQGQKKGRGGSRTPWQLLEDADDCKKSAALWREYALAFKGIAQLSWSRGLKDRCGLDDLGDDELDDDEQAGADVCLRSWPDAESWRIARRRLFNMLDAVENGTDLDAAEFGPFDQFDLDFAVLEVPPD